MNSPLTTKQKQSLDEALIGEDEWCFYENVESFLTTDPTKKLKLSKSLLALSKYRIYVFNNLKKRKDFHLLYLEDIGGTKKLVSLSFYLPSKSSKYYLYINSERVEELINLLFKRCHLISHGFPPSKRFKFSSKELKKPTVGSDIGPCEGIIETYRAYCNLLSEFPKRDVIDLFEVMNISNCHDLDLSNLAGIGDENAKSELSVQLYPIGLALKYNIYFRSVVLRNIEQKDAGSFLGKVIQGNSTITRIVCSNCNAEIIDEFGTAIRQNRNHKIQILQLNNNKVVTSSGWSLPIALAHFPHLLSVLDLSYCNIPSQALLLLCNSFRTNYGMSLGIEELNLSGNQFNSQASAAFISWIKDSRKYLNLKRLAIASTGISIGTLILELTVLPLVYLDISDNKFEKLTHESVGHFAETTKTLEIFKMSGMSFSLETHMKIIRTLFENQNLTKLHLDISRNDYGQKGIQLLSNCFKSGTSLRTLDISDNDLTEKGLISLLGVLNNKMERLIIDRNFTGVFDKSKPTSVTENNIQHNEFTNYLVNYLNTQDQLYYFSMKGSASSRLSPTSLSIFFEGLKTNKTIEEINLFGHFMGETAFNQFCDSLKINNTIKQINLDNNMVGYNGYLLFKFLLDKNKVIEHMSFPLLDYEFSKCYNKLRKCIFDINIILATRVNNVKKRMDPLVFDCEWATPEQAPKPLLQVPASLASIAHIIKEPLFDVNEDELNAIQYSDTVGNEEASSLSDVQKRKVFKKRSEKKIAEITESNFFTKNETSN